MPRPNNRTSKSEARVHFKGKQTTRRQRSRHEQLSTALTSPDQIAGLVGWYDFSDAASLFKDATRLLPVTADGDVILGVTDKSTGAHHLSKAVTGPTYKTNIQNGLSVSRYDGVDDQLGVTGWSQAQPITIILVAKGHVGTSAELYSSSTIQYHHYGSTAFNAGGTEITLAASSDDNFNIAVAEYNGASSVGWYNGGAGITGSVGTAGIQIGGFNISDGAGGETQDTCELLVYDTALSVADVQRLGAFLGTKWGITWTTAT